MNRPSRQQIFMEIAHIVAKRSTCYRLNVGALVVVNNRIVSIGYNGRASGEAHCEGNACSGIVPGQCGTIHAEVNALHFAVGALDVEEIRDLYVTHAPCPACAIRIGNSPIDRVFFGAPYRDERGIAKMYDANLEVYQVTPAGYVIDWRSKMVVTL